jgi:hypothetical protein
MQHHMIVSVQRLLEMSQVELDDLFRSLPAGASPTGKADGTAIVLPGTLLAKIIAPIARLLAWQGKVFRPDGRLLKNRVTPLGLRAIAAQVYRAPSWLDGQDCIVLDYSRSSLVARKVRDEIRELSPGVYLGIVYWGRRKTINFALEFS